MDRCSIDAHGTALTDETIAAAKSADAVLLGGPACGNGAVRPEPGLLKLRKGIDIYGKLWPCFFASGSLVDVSLPEASAERVDHMVGFLARGRGDKKVGSFDKAIYLRRKVMTETFEEVITPSIGLLPSANLSHILDIKGVPKLFGTILSVAMILCYSLNLPVEAKAVEGVIRVALKGGLHAKDLGGNTTTEEVGDAVVQELEKIPKA
ncbi:uncharacterized protein FPRO_05089 [Fusarium proliferatum ET1]|uniref:Related to LEU2-Beta-isopropyl-malate dehydrogenase n=1 Tax=Fusarium proliferatum (strain ET1) TaxID=1227346 RepID=A0A1L7VHV4_FUSPR|nr:uncharacterized protein FPRO_05089 [Fusarium proliferatum ET1]CZR40189.1 related to LEU2-Beta-isopropyl-malate dehydrogenase [Fusarium proliferatum ET1]